jgi:Fe-S cluster assembly iron-binding protein IscA
MMLTMTESAAKAIRTLADWDAEFEGLRLATDPAGTLTLSLARGPIDEDRVLERSGARLFLEPGVSHELEEKVLDATVAPKGRFDFNLEDARG